MNKLYVFNYTGNHFFNDNHTNLIQNFKNDSGVTPSIILEQPSKADFLGFLKTLEPSEDDQIVLHIISHGYITGIAKEKEDELGFGDKNTLIIWEELLKCFYNISRKCKNLFANVGTVCKSNLISIHRNYAFDYCTLMTNREISDPVKPRKANKYFFEGRIESFPLSEEYILD